MNSDKKMLYQALVLSAFICGSISSCEIEKLNHVLIENLLRRRIG